MGHIERASGRARRRKPSIVGSSTTVGDKAASNRAGKPLLTGNGTFARLINKMVTDERFVKLSNSIRTPAKLSSLFLYLMFVAFLVRLLLSMRSSEEHHFVHNAKRMFVTNTFDSDLNEFMDIRRRQDFWKWGNNVLIPSIFSNSPDGKQAWPDGDGYFAMDRAIDYDIQELRNGANQLDLVQGMELRQVRVRDTEQGQVPDFQEGEEDTAAFGYVPTDPKHSSGDSSTQPPFSYFTAEALGSSTKEWSASSISTQVYPGGGYVAYLIPFFSDQYIAPLEWKAGIEPEIHTEEDAFVAVPTDAVGGDNLNLPWVGDDGVNVTVPADAKPGDTLRVILDSGLRPGPPIVEVLSSTESVGSIGGSGFRDRASSRGDKKYFCVRTSTNGVDIKQVCDTMQGSSNRNANVVKEAAFSLLHSLRTQHWLDHKSRFVLITLQLQSPDGQVAGRVRLMVEFPSMRGALPSFQAETTNVNPDSRSSVRTYLGLCIAFVYAFIFVECGTLFRVGLKRYASNAWNYLDWANFFVFFQSAYHVYYGMLSPRPARPSDIANTVGYANLWRQYYHITRAKQLLAYNGCLLMLKATRYLNAHVPQMKLLSSTIGEAAFDLVFFAATFFISMFSFSNAFYVMMGSTMNAFYNHARAMHSLVRGLFGDFDIDKIDDNSPSSLNSVVFLMYLFASVFMILSMFFAILGDAQSTVLHQQEEEKAQRRKNKRAKQKLKIIKKAVRRISLIGIDVDSTTDIDMKKGRLGWLSKRFLPSKLRAFAKSHTDRIAKAFSEMNSTGDGNDEDDTPRVCDQLETLARRVRERQNIAARRDVEALKSEGEKEKLAGRAVKKKLVVPKRAVSPKTMNSTATWLAQKKPPVRKSTGLFYGLVGGVSGAVLGALVGVVVGDLASALIGAVVGLLVGVVMGIFLGADKLLLMWFGNNTLQHVGKAKRVGEHYHRIMLFMTTNLWAQFLLYLGFLLSFQMLLSLLRDPREAWYMEELSDTFLESSFDADHNSFMEMRRPADFWEWSRVVLLPGIFFNVPLGSTGHGRNCWSDGNGSFYTENGNPFDVDEILARSKELSVDGKNGGVEFRQVRAKPIKWDPESVLVGPEEPDAAAGEYIVQSGSAFGNIYPRHRNKNSATGRAPFGFNTTVDKMASSSIDVPFSPFVWFPRQSLGSAALDFSASLVNQGVSYAGDGYVAYLIPFFAKRYLPEQYGTASEVIDFRNHSLVANGTFEDAYYCIRTSTNGVMIHQLCEARFSNDTRNGGREGAVRDEAFAFVSRLKKWHWIDSQTRFVIVTLQTESKNAGMRAQVKLMFEFLASGGVLPSFDVVTRLHTHRWMWPFMVLIMMWVILFVVLELVALVAGGIFAYARDMWNYLDWLNVAMFFFSYYCLLHTFEDSQEMEMLATQKANFAGASLNSTAYATAVATATAATNSAGTIGETYFYSVAEGVGFRNHHSICKMYSWARQSMAINACLQILKIMKFTNQLVPKMGLLSAVLLHAAPDLLYFTITFGISLVSFAVSFYCMLGANMDDFVSIERSLLTLLRALFGDFDVNEIDDNSPNMVNSTIFLVYLFIAVFILLSMFLAILGEAQGVVLEQNRQQSSFGAESAVSIKAKAWLDWLDKKLCITGSTQAGEPKRRVSTASASRRFSGAAVAPISAQNVPEPAIKADKSSSQIQVIETGQAGDNEGKEHVERPPTPPEPLPSPRKTQPEHFTFDQQTPISTGDSSTTPQPSLDAPQSALGPLSSGPPLNKKLLGSHVRNFPLHADTTREGKGLPTAVQRLVVQLSRLLDKLDQDDNKSKTVSIAPPPVDIELTTEVKGTVGELFKIGDFVSVDFKGRGSHYSATILKYHLRARPVPGYAVLYDVRYKDGSTEREVPGSRVKPHEEHQKEEHEELDAGTKALMHEEREKSKALLEKAEADAKHEAEEVDDLLAGLDLEPADEMQESELATDMKKDHEDAVGDEDILAESSVILAELDLESADEMQESELEFAVDVENVHEDAAGDKDILEAESSVSQSYTSNRKVSSIDI